MSSNIICGGAEKTPPLNFCKEDAMKNKMTEKLFELALNVWKMYRVIAAAKKYGRL